MACPVLWPENTFLYPIGNTAPSCFTRNLAPEIDADILLLGCGDPRSILHTIHSDHCPCKSDFIEDPSILIVGAVIGWVRKGGGVTSGSKVLRTRKEAISRERKDSEIWSIASGRRWRGTKRTGSPGDCY